MGASGSKTKSGRAPGRFGLGLAACLLVVGGDRAPEPQDPVKIAVGRALFHREWRADDERGHGGDGLGPAYNDSSCVACHNAGGAGGAGPADKNVDILAMARNPTIQMAGRGPFAGRAEVPSPLGRSQAPAFPEGRIHRGRVVGLATATPPWNRVEFIPPAVSGFFDEMARITSDGDSFNHVLALHPGFRDARVVTLHRFGTDPNYDAWRDGRFPTARLMARSGPTIATSADMGEAILMSGAFTRGTSEAGDDLARRQADQDRARIFRGVSTPTSTHSVGSFVVTRSQRNPTSLFGLGRIDAIPEAAIVAGAERQARSTPGTAGRVGLVKGGRVGRLGWKGQTASVEDFVLDACAVEVGLEVPGHAQGALPPATRVKAKGLDLSADECAALVAYVKDLPRPVERPASGAEAAAIAEGKAAFAIIGCARCHVPDLGGVRGLYSDLLLHDMGELTAVSGSYGGSGSEDDESSSRPAAVAEIGPLPRFSGKSSTSGATKREWRTPPLWGARDSAPYLHDGRARTLEQAIALHGGQGEDSARRFFGLTPADRVRVEAFLKSLVAPGPGGPLAMR